jgi:hypothetical protein
MLQNAKASRHSSRVNPHFVTGVPISRGTNKNTILCGVHIKRFLSSKVNSLLVLDPYFVTGFVDGEGCFRISITKNQKYKTG